MPKVLIELDLLKSWVDKLDRNNTAVVAEEIYDEIDRIELETKTAQESLDEMKREREKSIQSIETPLTFNQIQVNKKYKFLSTVSFRGNTYDDLAGAEVIVVSKGRTKVKAQVLEPGKKTTGKVLNINPYSLTQI